MQANWHCAPVALPEILPTFAIFDATYPHALTCLHRVTCPTMIAMQITHCVVTMRGSHRCAPTNSGSQVMARGKFAWVKNDAAHLPSRWEYRVLQLPPVPARDYRATLLLSSVR